MLLKNKGLNWIEFFIYNSHLNEIIAFFEDFPLEVKIQFCKITLQVNYSQKECFVKMTINVGVTIILN